MSIVSNVISKILRFKMKITSHTINQRDLKLNEKDKSTDFKTGMTETLELLDGDLKIAVIKCLSKETVLAKK
jgi:hypothetical protein